MNQNLDRCNRAIQLMATGIPFDEAINMPSPNDTHREAVELATINFEEYTLFDRPHPTGMGGQQIVLRFPNNYGASIIHFVGSYGFDEGLMELAVLHFPDEGKDYALIYDTPITDDVLGHLSAEDVKDTCHLIMALPERITT